MLNKLYSSSDYIGIAVEILGFLSLARNAFRAGEPSAWAILEVIGCLLLLLEATRFFFANVWLCASAGALCMIVLFFINENSRAHPLVLTVALTMRMLAIFKAQIVNTIDADASLPDRLPFSISL